MTEISDPDISSRRQWSPQQLESLARSYSPVGLPLDEYGEGVTAHLAIYYLRGSYVYSPGATDASGAAAHGRAFIFRNESSTSLQRVAFEEQLEQRAAVHEWGHILGLVNCGIPMLAPREDPSSRCHSTNNESVMGGALVNPTEQTLKDSGGFTLEFDQNDLNDVAAFQASLRQAPRSE
jgi:hypothetical protein